MHHVYALAIKSALFSVILVIILSGIFGYKAPNTVILALLLVGVSYLVGDLYVLRYAGNFIATLVDVGTYTVIIWPIGSIIVYDYIPFLVSLFAAIALGIAEWFYHKYIYNHPIWARGGAGQEPT